MDSEMYSDFAASHKYGEAPYFVEKEVLVKKEDAWHKNVAEALGKIFDKVNEVDVSVGKRLDALVASISESKNATEKQPDPTLNPASDLQDVVASEVDQLLSDVQQLKNDVTGGSVQPGGVVISEVDQLLSDVQQLKNDLTETAPVQSGGGGDVDAKLASLQTQIDALKIDLNLVSENMMNLMNYLKSRGTSKPLALKGGVQDGMAVIYAVERV